MPSGVRYWTVIDEEFVVVAAADAFLRDARFGRDRAASAMGLFMTWLRYAPPDAGKAVVRGPGATPVRSEGRVNRILTAVRGFLMHAVAAKQAPGWVVGQLYEIADGRDLPWEAGGEDGGLVYRLKAHHRLQEPD